MHAKEFITASCLYTEPGDAAVVRRSSPCTAAPMYVPHTIIRPYMLSRKHLRSMFITVRNRVGEIAEPFLTPRQREKELEKELDK